MTFYAVRACTVGSSTVSSFYRKIINFGRARFLKKFTFLSHLEHHGFLLRERKLAQLIFVFFFVATV